MLYLVLIILAVISTDIKGDNIYWQLDKYLKFDPLHYFKPYDAGFYNLGSLTTYSDPEDHDHRVLRVFYQKGTYSASEGYSKAQFYSSPISSHSSLTFTYHLYFSSGFDFVRGGKLPGLSGGTKAKCSGGRYESSCFSARFMWRREGEGEIYAYIPQPSSEFCKRSDVICSTTGKGTSLGRGSFKFKTGKWMKVTQHVHLNDIGKDNGFVKIYIDDDLKYQGDNIIWRTHDDVKIDSIFFSTFFGGNTPEWAATHDCYTYFKEFVLSSGTKPPVIG